MNKSKKFSPEVRERAVRLVQEHHGEYPSLRAAIDSIAPKIGCVPQTLLDWGKRHEIDLGKRETSLRLAAPRQETRLPSEVIYGLVDARSDTHGVELLCNLKTFLHACCPQMKYL